MTDRIPWEAQLAEAIRILGQAIEKRNKAEAERHVAKINRLGLDAQNAAAEVRLRAERRAGELLRELVSREGDRRSESHAEILKLSDLGIDRNRSSRWQKEAAVPESVFEEYIRSSKSSGKSIATSGLLRFAARTDQTVESAPQADQASVVPAPQQKSDRNT